MLPEPSEHSTLTESKETKLGQVGDLQVVAYRQLSNSPSSGYILENGMEIEDTFAEMFSIWFEH